MKKILIPIFIILLFVLSACSDKNEKTETNESSMDSTEFFTQIPDQFVFSSGSGGWGEYLTIADDGTFTGEYFDTMYGSEYEWEEYRCDFTGKFTNIKKIDDKTYSMTVSDLKCKETPNTEEVIDNVYYYYTEPLGMKDGDEFKLYFPERSTSDIAEDAMLWVIIQDEAVLPYHVLHNVNNDSAYVPEEMDVASLNEFTVENNIVDDSLSENAVPTDSNESEAEDNEKNDKSVFEEFTGVYRCFDSEMTLLSNGLLSFEGENNDLTYTVEDFKREADGSYSWSITSEVDGVGVYLYPIGVEIFAWDGSIIPTDTSRVRLWSGQDVPTSEYIYYKVSD